MADDARISTGFPDHPKTLKVIKRLGLAGGWSLLRLLLWTASERHTGDLAGLSDEDIELAARWEGDGGALVEALIVVGYLEGDEGARRVHDWREHNPWAATRGVRVAKARAAAAARWGTVHATSIPQACNEHAQGNANSTFEQCPPPNPTQPKETALRAVVITPSADDPHQRPNGSAKKANGNGKHEVPFAEIVALYHESLPMLPKIEKLTKQRQGYIRQRWAEDLPTLDHWRNYFDFVRQSPFLTGRTEGRDGRPPFRATLEWLCRPSNYAKVAEEAYHR